LKREGNIKNESVFHLACGPDSRVFRYTSYLVNGWRFNVKDRDMYLKSQNSGVLVKDDENAGNLDYFSILIDIIELIYSGGNNVILFKCDWWDMYSIGRGYKEDKYGFILINRKHKLKTNEPYVLASQVQQVYYVKDTKYPNWLIVRKTNPQDGYDMPKEAINEECQENEEIGSISFISNEFDKEHEFSLDRKNLTQSTRHAPH